MLNGIDPIIIFNFEKLEPDLQEKISSMPIVSKLLPKVGLPPIPLYISQELTGLIIDNEEESVEIETKIETKSSGDEPEAAQKALGSTVKINMIGKKDSIGLILLSAMSDLILPKITSQEYSISYISGATTVFEGLLHSFNVQQTSNEDTLMITLEISKTVNKTKQKKKTTGLEPDKEAVNIDANSVSETPPSAPLKQKIKGPTPKAPGTQAPIQFKVVG